jgi:hypothetical protein
MRRCENALCDNIVNTHRTHHKVGDAYFCSSDCAQEWIHTNERLTSAARRFFGQPARMSSARRQACDRHTNNSGGKPF